MGGAHAARPRSRSSGTTATCCCPRSASRGRRKLLSSKVLLLGAGGLGSPAAMYLAAAGVGTIGIVDMDVVDESNLQRQILHNIDRVGDRKVDSAKKTLTALNPEVNVVDVRHAARCRQRARHHRRLRRHHRRRRQLPVALPAERRVAEEGHPGRPRIDLPVRGSGDGVPPVRRTVLPVHGARAAARRARPVVRRGRRARRAPRHHRLDPGARGDQAPPRPRRPASPVASSPTTRSSSRSAPTRCCAIPSAPRARSTRPTS